MKKKIRTLFVFIAFILSALPNRPTRIVHAQKASLPLLSQMTEEESIAFVEDRNIEIPKLFQKTSQLGEFIKSIIQKIETNPNYHFTCDYVKMYRFVKAIKNAVNEYYGIDWTTYTNQSRAAQYVLRDSLVQNEDGNWVSTGGAWDPRWAFYNCYAYAIDRFETKAFEKSDNFHYPGKFIGITEYLEIPNVETLSNYVKMDLEATGYINVEIHNIMPTISLNQNLICIRSGQGDFHLMKYDMETDAWYHKPGDSAILKYRYILDNYVPWTNEASLSDGTCSEGWIGYGSDIKYITYDKNEIKLDYGQSSDQIVRTIRASKDTMIEVKANVSEECLIQLESYSEMNVDLYDEEMEWIESYTGTNVCFSKEADYDTYYIRVNFTNPNHVGGVTVKGHYHTYEGHNCTYCGQYTESHDFGSPYLWINTQKHRASCSCGSTRLEGHAVSLSAYQANASYLICLLCGGKAESGFIQLGEKNQAEYRTGNGSFISSNGIVFLADEDIQSYLDHTLVWTISTGEEEA